MIDWEHVARELLGYILALLLAPLWVPLALGLVVGFGLYVGEQPWPGG